MLIDPKTVELTTQAGVTKTFLIGKYPAVAGREIVTKYPVANLPKLGDYTASEDTMLKLMAYVAVVTDAGQAVPLTTRALVDNHAGDWETLAKLEWASLEYNCSFFGNGRSVDFFETIARKAQALITQMLTGLSAQSSVADKPRSTS